MKSKGFTMQEAQQTQLQAAKVALLTDIGTKLEFTPEETTAAITAVNQWMSDWYMMGGRRDPRIKMEASWQRLKDGLAPETDYDRAAALQKAYTDITWDTRQMAGGQTLIRGVSGVHAAKIVLADKLGEDWSARTWPLTSWAVPAAQISVGNWVEDGILMSNDDVTRDEIFAMYHAEPNLREKGLKVKGEYILDGAGAIDSGTTSVERIFATKAAPAGGGGGYRSKIISDYLADGVRFHDQTGGGVDDYVLGSLYDGQLIASGDTGHTLYNTEDEHVRNYWQVLGFDEPPAALSAPKTVLPPNDPKLDSYLPYAERKRAEHDANNPQRYALAQELKAKGLDAETVAELVGWWHTVQWRSQNVEKMKKGLEMPYGGNGYPSFDGKPYPPRDAQQAAAWQSIIAGDEQSIQAARDEIESIRSRIGIDNPLPTPIEVY